MLGGLGSCMGLTASICRWDGAVQAELQFHEITQDAEVGWLQL